MMSMSIFVPAAQLRSPGELAAGRHRDSSHHNNRSARHKHHPVKTKSQVKARGRHDSIEELKGI